MKTPTQVLETAHNIGYEYAEFIGKSSDMLIFKVFNKTDELIEPTGLPTLIAMKNETVSIIEGIDALELSVSPE